MFEWLVLGMLFLFIAYKLGRKICGKEGIIAKRKEGKLYNVSYVWLPDVNTNLSYVWLPDVNITLSYVWLPDVNTNLSYIWLPDVNTNLFYVWLPDLSIDLVINFT